MPVIEMRMNQLSTKIKEFYTWWKREPPREEWRMLIGIFIGGIILTPLVARLPLPGHDWYRVFHAELLEPYPPWKNPIFLPFQGLPWRWALALVNSWTLMGVATLTAFQARRLVWDGLLAAGMALLVPPLWYLLWDGQIDGLVLLGTLLLPWSVPLILLRPQILGWVLLSRRRWTLAMVIWILITFVIWGWWPPEMFAYTPGSIIHPSAMGWATLGWPIFLVGLWMLIKAGRNPWAMLAAAFFASPYVQPYHMVMLLPALGRIEGSRRWLVWAWAWVVGLEPGIMGITRYLALGFPFLVWWYMREDKRETFSLPWMHSRGQ
jgi:hypothetical protein